jgi:inosine/xanthosine triphosphatase
MSDEESITGATNRAKAALEAVQADYGVGLEGGLQQTNGEWFDCGWIAVVSKQGELGLGATVRVAIPPAVLKLIESGMELGDVCDVLFEGKNTKHDQGYFGLITKGVISRTNGYKDAVVMALVRFVHPQLFE